MTLNDLITRIYSGMDWYNECIVSGWDLDRNEYDCYKNCICCDSNCKKVIKNEIMKAIKENKI